MAEAAHDPGTGGLHRWPAAAHGCMHDSGCPGKEVGAVPSQHLPDIVQGVHGTYIYATCVQRHAPARDCVADTGHHSGWPAASQRVGCVSAVLRLWGCHWVVFCCGCMQPCKCSPMYAHYTHNISLGGVLQWVQPCKCRCVYAYTPTCVAPGGCTPACPGLLYPQHSHQPLLACLYTQRVHYMSSCFCSCGLQAAWGHPFVDRKGLPALRVSLGPDGIMRAAGAGPVCATVMGLGRLPGPM
jgi:hypothetical protein